MIDSRGPRFAAIITTVVLAITLVTGSAWLLAAQIVVFATAAVFGMKAAPYGRVYAALIRPRLAPPDELEDENPPRFAQAVGLVFGVLGLVSLLAGWSVAFYVLIGAAFAAAFLNAAFGFCLGCEIYLLVRRTTSRSTAYPPEVTTS